jgi:hypothetical protein
MLVGIDVRRMTSGMGCRREKPSPHLLHRNTRDQGLALGLKPPAMSMTCGAKPTNSLNARCGLPAKDA